jgi:hypothetical protein
MKHSSGKSTMRVSSQPPSAMWKRGEKRLDLDHVWSLSLATATSHPTYGTPYIPWQFPSFCLNIEVGCSHPTKAHRKKINSTRVCIEPIFSLPLQSIKVRSRPAGNVSKCFYRSTGRQSSRQPALAPHILSDPYFSFQKISDTKGKKRERCTPILRMHFF